MTSTHTQTTNRRKTQRHAHPLRISWRVLGNRDYHFAEAALNGTKISGPYLVDPATGEATDDPTNFFLRTGTFSRVSDINGATVFSSPRIYALNVASRF